MQSWVVTGAGDGTYDGAYAKAGMYNGKPYYTNPAGDRYLYYIPGGLPAWYLGDALPMTPPAYLGTYNEDLPANPWSVGFGGVGPAPTVFRTHVFGIVPDLTQVEIR